ncbi:MAG: DUF1116 domain-containing protein [Pseudolabrys sp.]|nr:DUF1116 domain-containing protein [Pseudolabrys sp.]
MTQTSEAVSSSRSALSGIDAIALQAMLRVEPLWSDLVPASEAIALPDKVVLHAGPPVGDAPSAPIRNSAAMAVLFEGWAETEADAFRMIDRGAVRLVPAQDHAAVVPLAAVLTRSMLVQVVSDRHNANNRTVSPLNGGNGPAMRLGKAGADVVRHLHWLNGEFAMLWRALLKHPVPLLPIANAALARGDDLHGRTMAATDILARDLFGASEPIPFLQQGPSFFLNLWMAACQCMARAAVGIGSSSAVIAIGSNGNAFGLKIAGCPDRWFTATAEPPSGNLEAGFTSDDRLGAIGDSAIVDAQGFGAMAMHCAPAQEKGLGPFMPASSRDLGRVVMSADDSRFPGFAIRSGLFARPIADGTATPAISLGILDRAGRSGRIGGGVYVTPRAPFVAARDALKTNN